MKRKFLRTKKIDNPFIDKPKQERSVWREYELVRKAKWVGVFLIFCGIIYMVVYAPVLRVKKIVISEVDNIEVVNELQSVVRNKLGGYSYLVWPNDNLLFLNVDGLVTEIGKRITLDELRIKKKYLNSLKIEAREKIPVLIWNEADEYYYVDRGGVIMSAVPLEDIKYDLPMINRGTTTQVTVGKQMINRGEVEFINKVLVETGDRFGEWVIVRVMVKRPVNNEIYFYTSEGWYFILPVDGEIVGRLENLDRLLKQKIEDRGNLEYVDLRLLDKLFYK